jgi:anti-sigma-K factor RskA
MTPGTGHDDLAGYVLGALDPGERERFTTHLRSCPECQQVVAELTPAAQALESAGFPSGLLDDAEPPADLEQRTLKRVERAARKTPARPRRRHLPSRTWLVSAAAAVVVVAGSGAAVTVLESGPAAAATFAMKAADGGSGSGHAAAYRQSSGWSIKLTLHHLKQLPRGSFYECWYAGPDDRPGHPDLITAGSFTVGQTGTATTQMWSAADPVDFRIMQITVQSRGDGGRKGAVILSGSART